MAMQVYARLVGGHKAAVTALQVLGSREEAGHDLLISASVDGSVAVWEPSSSAPQGPDKERLPKVSCNDKVLGLLIRLAIELASSLCRMLWSIIIG